MPLNFIILDKLLINCLQTQFLQNKKQQKSYEFTQKFLKI
jgi:hemerythrin superfamily protein